MTADDVSGASHYKKSVKHVYEPFDLLINNFRVKNEDGKSVILRGYLYSVGPESNLSAMTCDKERDLLA